MPWCPLWLQRIRKLFENISHPYNVHKFQNQKVDTKLFT